jgi:hypothetical protein
LITAWCQDGETVRERVRNKIALSGGSKWEQCAGNYISFDRHGCSSLIPINMCCADVKRLPQTARFLQFFVTIRENAGAVFSARVLFFESDGRAAGYWVKLPANW